MTIFHVRYDPHDELLPLYLYDDFDDLYLDELPYYSCDHLLFLWRVILVIRTLTNGSPMGDSCHSPSLHLSV